MTTRSDRPDALGEICNVLRALMAIAGEALIASAGRLTLKGCPPGPGGFTRMECSVAVLLGSVFVSRLLRGIVFSAGCRGRDSLVPGAIALRAVESAALPPLAAEPALSIAPFRSSSFFSVPGILASCEFAAGREVGFIPCAPFG